MRYMQVTHSSCCSSFSIDPQDCIVYNLSLSLHTDNFASAGTDEPIPEPCSEGQPVLDPDC